MDPITAIGLISSGFQIAQVIGQTVAGLASLRGRYKNADLTIRSLIGELSIIKAAITQLEDWARYNSRDFPENREYNEGLTVALEGCRAVMEILSEEVAVLTQCSSNESEALGFMGRAKMVWNDDVMRAHHDRLHAQVLALQLLLQACQCRSLSEQIDLLRRAENRRIIQKVADDTETLRTSASHASSRREASSISHRLSLGDTEFEFDDDVVTSLAYRRALQRTLSRPVVHNSIRSNQTRTTDEGYASGGLDSIAPSSDINSKLVIRDQRGPSSPPQLSSAGYARSKSVTFRNDTYGASSEDFKRSQSYSTNRTLSVQNSGSKRDKFRSALRRLSSSSRLNLSLPPPPSPQLSTNRGSVKARRERERELETSIDLHNAEEASAPVIVKIAQSGSRHDVEQLIDNGHDIEARHGLSGRNALHVAAHCSKDEVLDLLIRNEAKLDIVDASGSTALHLAASRGHLGCLALLLAEDVNLEAKDLQGSTALWIAADQGQREAVTLLVAYRAKVNARANNQMTVLHAAARQGDEETVRRLLSMGANLEAKDADMKSALHHACSSGHLGVIEVLLKAKANIDIAGPDRRTPLICAAAEGKVHVVECLLRRKASYMLVDDAKMTALHWAAFNGHEEIVGLLCQKKGLLIMTNMTGRTPMHLAIMNSQFAVVEQLLQRGASVDAQCDVGFTPLHYACVRDNTEIARLLLLSGSNIEAQSIGDQRRPIHVAAASGSMAMTTLLCEKGASIHARDKEGERPLCISSRLGHFHVVQELLERGSPTPSGHEPGLHEALPLCLAAKEGHLPVAALLVHYGASVWEKDRTGWHSVHYAAHFGHFEVLGFLLNRSGQPLVNKGDGTRLTVDEIGFSANGSISDVRKSAVDVILREFNGHAHDPTVGVATQIAVKESVSDDRQNGPLSTSLQGTRNQLSGPEPPSQQPPEDYPSTATPETDNTIALGPIPSVDLAGSVPHVHVTSIIGETIFELPGTPVVYEMPGSPVSSVASDQ